MILGFQLRSRGLRDVLGSFMGIPGVSGAFHGVEEIQGCSRSFGDAPGA